jgi:hypothetical protein
LDGPQRERREGEEENKNSFTILFTVFKKNLDSRPVATDWCPFRGVDPFLVAVYNLAECLRHF